MQENNTSNDGVIACGENYWTHNELGVKNTF